MNYEILGKTVPVVEVTLNKGEAMYSQTGGMSWQTEGISMKTNAKGGILKSLGRMFSGESIFMNTYTAETDGAKNVFNILMNRNKRTCFNIIIAAILYKCLDCLSSLWA